MAGMEMKQVSSSDGTVSRVVVLPGQQHIAMDTDPGLFVREVVRFLLE